MIDKHGFYSMYYLLCKYERPYGLGGNVESFGLGSFLAGMTPTSWTAVSADPAYWMTWLEILKKENISQDMNREDLLKAIRAFTQKHENEYGFDFEKVPDKLRSIAADDLDLDEAIRKSQALLEYGVMRPKTPEERLLLMLGKRKIGLKDFKEARFLITWKLINLGFRVHNQFAAYLSAEAIIDYAQRQRVITHDEEVSLLAGKDKKDITGIDCRVRSLAEKESTSYELEFRKWRVLWIRNGLPDIEADYTFGLTKLEDLWARFDFPDDTPHVIRGKNNAITPDEYYTEKNYKASLKKNQDWVSKEIDEIRKKQ
jgi:hypothetical protein